MTTITGFDYSFTQPDVTALVKARAGFAGRYVSNEGNEKNITAGEFARLQAAHIPLVLFYETTAEWMLGGRQAGVKAAFEGRAQATAAGIPATVPLHYAADFPVTPEQVPAVLDALGGAASVDGKATTALYGGMAIVRAAADQGYRVIQTAAWSAGQWDQRAILRQLGTKTTIGGVEVDVDEAIGFNFGQYTPPAPPFAGQVFAYHPDAPQLHAGPVAQWQQRMRDRGWIITVDGWYGEQSAKVCTAFQTQFKDAPAPGLAVDGIVGPHTWAAAYTIPITR